ncbi:uncharacterized protein L3040_004864 [Drepanopeziza brunnea f. sp. 'multigermtubi']|uniref:uncharacterized protein n=1 Tax=Drepanopeziza brunnea f. sp. 'multigermtubi' TaxID=698441 RepID=UPI0023A74D23|nr:hypothetical protein L3040_004864 [Drepanopeziza brunnea f. sp. 'multigermtubi']
MSAIGSLVFCTDCANMLDSSSGSMNSVLVCDYCGAHNKDTASKTIITSTQPSSFPSLLRQKRSEIQQIERGDLQNEATIKVTCTECGRDEVRYTAVQLRSADEGSTIFYRCECGNKWNTNN